jgi:hypothetical protein
VTHLEGSRVVCSFRLYSPALLPPLLVLLQGEQLRIRRPHDYNPTAAKALGPLEPSPYLNLALLGVVGALADDQGSQVQVLGLPLHLGENEVRGEVGVGEGQKVVAATFCSLVTGGWVAWVEQKPTPSLVSYQGLELHASLGGLLVHVGSSLPSCIGRCRAGCLPFPFANYLK